MTDWTWEYNPSEEYVADGLAPGVVAEVERLATELAALGIDTTSPGTDDVALVPALLLRPVGLGYSSLLVKRSAPT
ncbi:hypothetical protein [Streptomyces violaceusniger]|uniref:Uncharacterized protein n=1 Tax=Streptomyces violaceusniger TaxID=68280 RepID=A0A4D4L080_STRVO|nr:hypothetical protein SVIO_027800 [Streptomyces violaceusniger]